VRRPGWSGAGGLTGTRQRAVVRARCGPRVRAERVRTGTLNFQDLLIFAARLLRDSPPARRELSDRYRFLLVDEFQDTDPIQAEVLFLLASDEELDLFDAAALVPERLARRPSRHGATSRRGRARCSWSATRSRASTGSVAPT
jgi:superfamily I DNA/RNA helicase